MFKFIKNLFSRFFSETKNDFKQNPKTGVVPSPTDFRDVNTKDVLGAINLAPLPDNYRVPYLLPVKYQGSEPSCVGWSCATIKDEKERHEQNDFEGDGSWLYKQCKLVDNYSGPGTYFRVGLERLKSVGIKPLPVSTVQGAPATFAIGGYARIDLDFDSLKRAVYQFGPCLVGFYCDSAGWKNAYVRPPKTIEYGHAIVIIGWDKTHLIGQNSWGEGWGDKGLFYVPKEYIDDRYAMEAWAVLSDMPTIIKKTEKPDYEFKNDLWAGLRNDEVRILQDALKWLGCLDLAQESTGFFGVKTMDAVIVFQKRHGISPMGRVGPQTRDKLNLLLK